MTPSSTLQAYVEQFALLSLEKQDKLALLTGEHMQELDIDGGVMRFGSLAFPVQVIGTESDNTLTWLWAWADEQTEIPPNLMQSAIHLRNWGSAEGLRTFTLPSVDLNSADGQIIAMIGSEVCKASCFYRDGYEGGAVYLLLFDPMIDSQPPFDRTRMLRQMSDLFSRYDLNHRNAVRSYLRRKDPALVEEKNVLSAELESGERLVAEFDTSDRLIAVNGASFVDT